MDRYIDDNLKYCPRCQEEYRAEIETCVDCNITLLSGVDMKALLAEKVVARNKGSMEIKPDDELVDIRRGALLQMKELQNLLAQHGLPALVVKDEQGCGQGCCGPELLLRVRRADIQAVITVLEEEHIRTTALHAHDTSHANAVFNTHAEQATCPACGNTFPTSQTTCPDCGLCFA